MKKKIIFLLVIIFSLSACTETESTNDLITIGVSISPISGIVKEIASDNVNVVTTIPKGYSPENYEPSIKEITTFTNCDVYFTSGVPAEDNILNNLSEDSLVVSLVDAIDLVYDPLYIENSIDPHMWLSPKRIKVIAKTITEALVSLDPTNSSVYESNLERYLIKVEQTDLYIKNNFDNKNINAIITYHPSLSYYCDDYGITMYSIEQDGKDATIKVMAELIEIAKENNIKTVFYQDEISGIQLDSFCEEIGAEKKSIDPLASDILASLVDITDSVAKEIR